LQIVVKKIKNASTNILGNFRGFQKNVIFNVLLMIIGSITHVFIKPIFRAPEEAPPCPYFLKTFYGLWRDL
jgi:hypothetical protein